MMLRTLVRTAMITAAVAVLAAACGRAGPPYTPYQAAVNARKEAQQDHKPLPPEPRKPPADRHFLLDPLIQ